MKLRNKERTVGEKDLVGSFAAQTGKYGILILMISLIVLFSALRPESFATFNNYRAILDNRTIVALLALAAMTPLIVGQFDLSIAAVLSLSHILVVGFIGQSQMNVLLAVLLTIIFSSMYGLINGIIVVKFKVDAFVATLATGSILGGAGLWYTGGRTLYNDVPRSFTQISRGRLFGMPLNAVYVLIIAATLWIFLSNLPAGRRMYATGGNRRAAELTGIRTDRYVMAAFVVSSTLAGIAGVMLGSNLGTASPSTGSSLLLPAFAGAFLGATTIRPGRFNVVGTVVAVYALSIAISGLQQLGAPVWFESVFNGTALAASVTLSGWAVRLRAERAKTRQLRLLDEHKEVRQDSKIRNLLVSRPTTTTKGEIMNLDEIMSTNGTNRFYKKDDVPDAKLLEAMSIARFAPQGGNRQPVRFIVVKDPAKKKKLAEWYNQPWKAYLQGAKEGTIAIGGDMTVLNNADHFADHLHEVPAIVVVCASLGDLHPTDHELGRLSVVGGCSIYPTVQNFLLKCREQGIATSLTTLLCIFEPQVKELLGIPEGYITAAHIAVGYSEKPFPKKLSRMPVGEMAFKDSFGSTFPGA